MTAGTPLQLPRGRRGLAAGLLALVVLALAVLGAVAAFQVHAGRDTTALGHVGTVSRWLRTHDWSDAAVLGAGIAAVAVGLVLIVVGLVRPARKLVGLDTTGDADPTTVLGIARAGLRRDLTSVAAGVDGVSRAKVSVGRSRVTVRATSVLRDRSGVDAALGRALDERLAELAPQRPLRVRVRLTGKAG